MIYVSHLDVDFEKKKCFDDNFQSNLYIFVDNRLRYVYNRVYPCISKVYWFLSRVTTKNLGFSKGKFYR